MKCKCNSVDVVAKLTFNIINGESTDKRNGFYCGPCSVRIVKVTDLDIHAAEGETRVKLNVDVVKNYPALTTLILKNFMR